MLIKYLIYYYLRYLKRINTPKALIKYAVKKSGDKVITVKDGEDITLHQINENANRISAGLTGLGLKKGDKVGVWLHNSIEFIEIRLACYKCGFVFCALIDDFSIDQATEVLQDIECKVLFYDSSLNVSAFKEKRGNFQLPYFIHTDINTQLNNSLNFNELIKEQSCKEPKLKIKPGEISAIGFTSGTTGKCKGVVWTHKAWLYSFYHFLLNSQGALSEDCVFLHVVPFSTAGSLVILPSLVSGTKSIFLQRFEKTDVAKIIEREKVTHLILPPSFLIDLWDYYIANQGKYNFTSLQSISVGSAILYSKKWEEMIITFGPIIQQTYGMAEVLAPLASLKISNTVSKRKFLKSVGKSIPQIKIKIVEKDMNGLNHKLGAKALLKGHLLNYRLKAVVSETYNSQGFSPKYESYTATKSGNIFISGRTVAVGYWKNEELTQKHFRGKWFKTSDIGYFDGDGYLYVVDRVVNIFEINGHSIVSREIEEIIHEFPGVKEVCVTCNNNELLAYLSERSNHTVKIDELQKFCQTKLQEKNVPEKFIILEEIPRSSSGKILRNKLKTNTIN